MSDRDPFDPHLSLSDQALAWLARLQKGDISKAEQHRFQEWCDQDPRHQAAFDQAVQFWQLLDKPAQNVRARLLETISNTNKPKQTRYRLGFVQAACFILALGGLITWLPTQIQNWRSDYVTAVGERRVLNLEDGSRLTLNTGSAVAVQFFAAQRTVKLLRGEAFFEVAADKARPFVVVADEISARAVGTAFSVAAFDGNHGEVAVSEGVVAVTAGKESRQLSANQQVSWHNGGLESVQSDDTEYRLAWRRGQVVFTKRSLAEVIREVNRYRKWPILIANRQLAQRNVSGVFKTDDPNAVISALTHTLSARAIGLPGGVAVIY